MFNSLTGTVTEKSFQRLCLDTHGIEWEISVPESADGTFPAIGEKAKVYTWLQHTEAAMALYGFADAESRSLFFELLKVDGVGPKAALKIMGSVSPAELSAILDKEDLSALQKVPGVGKKTAAKMLLQLKGKLSFAPAPAAKSEGAAFPAQYQDVATGLVSMGYDRKLVEQALATLAKSLSKAPAFSSLDAKGQEDMLFRSALVELAQ